MKRRAKAPKVDGLGPIDIRRIRSAIRQIWQRSHPRQLVVKRCLLSNGFSRCEKCRKKVAKVLIDHIEKVGEMDGGYIQRLFCGSHRLQGLCKACHDAKTRLERMPDFF